MAMTTTSDRTATERAYGALRETLPPLEAEAVLVVMLRRAGFRDPHILARQARVRWESKA